MVHIEESDKAKDLVNIKIVILFGSFKTMVAKDPVNFTIPTAWGLFEPVD